MHQGSLFPENYLVEGITESEAWHDLDVAEVDAFFAKIDEIFALFPVDRRPNEATTEQDLILKVLEALGWADTLPQQTASGKRRSDVPDILLFEDAEAKARANAEKSDHARYRHGRAIVESKRWRLALDRRSGGEEAGEGVPSTQMLRYLSRAEVASEKRIQWGILTNGRHWRLYFQGARSRSEEFLEIDLALLASIEDIGEDVFAPTPEQREHWKRVFFLMFRRAAFLPRGLDGRTEHQIARDEGRLWEEKVADDLSRVVFDFVFRDLMRGLAAGDAERPKAFDANYLGMLRDSALTLLYRLLFVLYAEDRNLLPPNDTKYDDYSLRNLRLDIAHRRDADDAFSEQQDPYFQHVRNLFEAISGGDESIGLPPYNGGLFDAGRTPLLARARLPDAVFAPVLDALSRLPGDDRPRMINYRDLSVQQLGSVYERLLEFEPVVGDDGEIDLRPNIFARKGSGSYYTPESLVGLIIERTLGPLVGERLDAFSEKAKTLASTKRPKARRLKELEAVDPATAILDLKICDPAMGSGHFLVSLVDYLADRVLEAVAEAEFLVPWADADAPYHSPLSARIENIRARIADQAKAHGWAVAEDQLDDRHIVRRMILKRSVYGVDKNPMAVELAKVALWLHTFTVGAPLSFLDHHLRCGDSLFGEWVRPMEDELFDRHGMLIKPYIAQARNASSGMEHIEEMTDADIAEIRESSKTFDGVTADTEPLSRFLDFHHALRWRGRGRIMRGSDDAEAEDALLDGAFGDPFPIIAGYVALPEEGEVRTQEELYERAAEQLALMGKKRKTANVSLVTLRRLLEETRALAIEERYFHWEVAFPGVWRDWESADPVGGFDAVIGNPPWDRIKMQEVEWFAARDSEIAHAPRAADRKRMIRALGEADAPLWRDYVLARDRAESGSDVARATGQYPLLARGDINIYALFVERAHRLIKRDGMVGLLVPSGIASDLGSSDFFGGVATSGRLAALLDFENKRVFFPEVDSRFKFCVFVAGGRLRRFHAECAFFLHDVAAANDPDRVFILTAEDFAAVNPNTGTAPVFRTARDAAITTDIYGRVPVLVDRRAVPSERVWPVHYVRMFDMTNDSGFFNTRAELEGDGAYPVAGNRLKKGDTEFVPLYEGKMVQAYDHRAASIVINPENLHRPAQPEPATKEQHQNPDWLPDPQFWVATETL